MFTARQLSVSVMLSIATFSYSMDSVALAKGSKKKEDTIYRAICECRFIAQDTEQGLNCRVRAASRTTRAFDQYAGMKYGPLGSPDGDRYAWMSGNKIAIRHETPRTLYSVTIIQMPKQIVSCAFNDNGTVFASATANELYVSDVVSNGEKESQLLLERLFKESVQHVALSDSGNRVAVGIRDRNYLRFMIIDTQKNLLLHDLPGFSCPDRPGDCCFFYMMNENVIATCSTVPYKQYDLEVVRVLETLTEEQKGLIFRVYKYLKRRKKVCICSKVVSSLIFILRCHW